MRQNTYIKGAGAVLLLAVLVCSGIWWASAYRSSSIIFRQTQNQALAKAASEELNMRIFSLGDQASILIHPRNDTAKYATWKITTADTVIYFRVKRDDPTNLPKAHQSMLAFFMPPNLNDLDSLFRQCMSETGLSIEGSYIEYLDLKKNKVVSRSALPGYPGNYVVSNTDTLDILKTIGVRAYAKTSAGTILKPVMSQMIISTALIVAALVCLGWLLAAVYRQQRVHEETIGYVDDRMREISRAMAAASEESDRFMLKLREMQLEKEAKELDRSKFHSFRLTLFGIKAIEIIKNEKNSLLIQKTDVSLRLIFREMQVKHETIEHRKKVTINIPEEDIVIKTDEKHFCNVIDTLLGISVSCSSVKDVQVEIVTLKDEKRVEIIIHDDGGRLSEADITQAFTRPYNVNRYEPGFEVGLRYVREVVSALGGSIIVRGQKNRFTEFTIMLPLA